RGCAIWAFHGRGARVVPGWVVPRKCFARSESVSIDEGEKTGFLMRAGGLEQGAGAAELPMADTAPVVVLVQQLIQVHRAMVLVVGHPLERDRLLAGDASGGTGGRVDAPALRIVGDVVLRHTFD